MITLHHVPQSRSMRVLWLLNELDVPFQLVEHPFDKSLRRPEFLSLSPAGRVPALEIEGERMFESGAMVEYLCEKFPDRGLGRLMNFRLVSKLLAAVSMLIGGTMVFSLPWASPALGWRRVAGLDGHHAS